VYNYSVQFFFSLSHWCRHFCDFCLILLHTRRALALHPSDATHRLHDRNEYWQFNKDCNIINGNFSTPRTLYETRHVEMSGCTKTEQLFWADASRKQVMSLENVTGDIKSLRFNAQHSSTLSSCENRSHFYVSHCTLHSLSKRVCLRFPYSTRWHRTRRFIALWKLTDSIHVEVFCRTVYHRFSSFLSASLYFIKIGAYLYRPRLCRDVVGWLSRACTVAKRCILGL